MDGLIERERESQQDLLHHVLVLENAVVEGDGQAWYLWFDDRDWGPPI
jgi:hypothetical protein